MIKNEFFWVKLVALVFVSINGALLGALFVAKTEVGDFQVVQRNSNQKVCQIINKIRQCYKVIKLSPREVK